MFVIQVKPVQIGFIASCKDIDLVGSYIGMSKRKCLGKFLDKWKDKLKIKIPNCLLDIETTSDPDENGFEVLGEFLENYQTEFDVKIEYLPA